MQVGPDDSADAGGLAVLRLSVLGEFRAWHRGIEIDLGGRRQRAVLALLLLARGEVVSADRLIDSLWGESTPPGATGTLQAYISHLRRRLEPDRTGRSRTAAIVRKGVGYALVLPEDAVDAWRFDRLVQAAGTLPGAQDRARVLSEALALWRGPALAEYAEEPWAQTEASRLAELRAVAREQLLALRLDTEPSAIIVPEIEALVSEQPLREERWRLLVLALYRSHRQGDALAALRRARQVLADELGLDPGPALRALEAEVLAQSPALHLPPNSPGTPQPRPEPIEPAPPRRPGDALVERSRELREIETCLDEIRDGQARLVLVEGPAGIGKTRLLTAGRRMAADRGATTLGARGSQLEREYAFGAVRQLFEAAVHDPGRGAGLLAGAAASAGTVFELSTGGSHGASDSSLAVLHGLYWLTVNLAAAGPLVLAIDDLQWCDTGSLRFLAYLIRRMEGLPILVLATLRTGEPHDHAALLAELAQDVATVPIRPSPLSMAGTGDLVRRQLGDRADDTFIAACHRSTSGNPLLLRQLLRALQAEGVQPELAHAERVTAIGSRAVSNLVLMRLARLPAHVTRTSRAIAVLGSGATLPMVARLADLTEDETVAAVGLLTRADLLRDEYPLSFEHPLVADAVYRDLPPGERQLWHERAAHHLWDTGASPEQVAAHLLQVPCRADSWAVDVLRAAAARAADRGAADAATTHLTRALAEPPAASGRPAVLAELGRLEAMTNRADAVRHLREAYETQADPARRAAVAHMLAHTLVFVGARGEPTAFCRRAAAELPADMIDERQSLVAWERASGDMHALDPAEWGRDDEPDVIGVGLGARMLAAALAWETLAAGVDRRKAVELARFALADGILLDGDTGLLWSLAANVLEWAGEDISSFWDSAFAHAHQRGSMFAALAVHLWRGEHLRSHGDLREAHESFIAAADMLDQWGADIGSGYSDAYIVNVRLDLGDLVGAREFVNARSGRMERGDGGRLFAEAHARVLIAEARYPEALTSIALGRELQPEGANPVWWPHRSLTAQAIAGLGRRDEAVALVEDELDAARRWGAPVLVGRTLRVLGELKGIEGVAELREAVALLSSGPARLELARARHALASLAGPIEGLSLLRQALDQARQCGADGLARLIASDLTGRGVTEPLEPVAPMPTVTERRVASMAASGANEREIAQKLFLTPATVRRALATVRGH